MADRAKLNGEDLPIQFSYDPPSPDTRHVVHKVGDGGIVVHGNPPDTGDVIVSWRLTSAERSEWHALLAHYTSATRVTDTLPFLGYWGEEFTVKTLKPMSVRVRGTLFDMSGEFLIITVTSWGTVS